MGFFLCCLGMDEGGGHGDKKTHFPKICHTCPTIMRLGLP